MRVFTLKAKVLSVMLCMVLSLSMPLSVFAENRYFDVQITGVECYDYAWEVLDLLNKEREKIGRNPLQMDQELLEFAMLRSAETAVYWSHTRPNNESLIGAENCGYGHANPKAIIEGWMNSDGHRANMLADGMETIGIGVFLYEGTYCWVQNFSGFYHEPSGNAVPRSGERKTVTRNISVSTEYMAISSDVTSLNLHEGESVAIPNISVRTYEEGYDMARYPINLKSTDFVYTPTSEIIKVDNGKIHAREGGRTTLEAALDSAVGSPVSFDISVSAHNYNIVEKSEVTCTTDGVVKYKCDSCDDTYIETTAKTGHTFDAGTITKPASCEEAGVKTYTCASCKERKTESIPALGHRYKTKVVAPTCTQNGYTLHTCEVCGGSYKDTYVDRLGHSYTSSEVLKEAACAEDGQQRYTCNRCGDSVTETIPAFGHDYTKNIIVPTCTEKGYTVYTCNTCGDCYEGDFKDPLGHDYIETVIQEPTHLTEGIMKYTCTGCGDTFTGSIPMVEHDFRKTATAPTCTERGYTVYNCDECGYETTADYVAAMGHTYIETVEIPSICTEKGTMLHSCKDCDDSYRSEIPMSEHDYRTNVIKATCTEKGYTIYECKDCGNRKMDDYTDPIGHDYLETIITKPSCMKSGWAKYECQNANCEETYEAAVSAAGHSYEKTVTAPTCTEQGYTTYSCQNCEETYLDDYTNPAGHNYISKVVKEATCQEAGERLFTCTECGDSYTVEISRTDHIYGEWEVVKEATTASKGTKRRVCTLCGEEENQEIEKLKASAGTKTSSSGTGKKSETSGTAAPKTGDDGVGTFLPVSLLMCTGVFVLAGKRRDKQAR